MPKTLTNCDAPDSANLFEIARFLRAFVECNRQMQDIVLEMVAIIESDDSTYEERTLACDAMMEALFPGTAADVLEEYHKRLALPEAVAVAESLRGEETGFAERVKKLMVAKNVTQSKLAEAAGIGQPAVSNILNRRCRPQRRTILRFAEALGVLPEELWPDFVKESLA
jgi:lambda repressor-like predicted transcriptional regulator